MIVCDICGGRFESSYNARVHISPEIHGLWMHDISSASEEKEQDFCQACWSRVVRYIEKLREEHK